MNEQTITVHDGHKKNPTVLNRSEYDALCASGMMWEFHPDAPLKWPYPDKATPTTPDQPTATATPRTDAQPLVKIYDRAGMPYDSELVSPDFARTLERELSSAQAALAEAKAEVAEFQTELRNAQTKLCDALTEMEQIKHKLFIEEENRNQLAILGHENTALRADIERVTNTLYDRVNDVIALRAEVAELREDKARLEHRLMWARKNCRVVFYPPDNTYPVEHAPHASKDQWETLATYADQARKEGA